MAASGSSSIAAPIAAPSRIGRWCRGPAPRIRCWSSPTPTRSRSATNGAVGRGSGRVACERAEHEGQQWISATHDSYRQRFGLTYTRQIFLAADGEDMRGEDQLTGRPGAAFAVRFHLHPSVQASLVQDGAAALLRLPSGMVVAAARSRCRDEPRRKRLSRLRRGAQDPAGGAERDRRPRRDRRCAGPCAARPEGQPPISAPGIGHLGIGDRGGDGGSRRLPPASSRASRTAGADPAPARAETCSIARTSAPRIPRRPRAAAGSRRSARYCSPGSRWALAGTRFARGHRRRCSGRLLLAIVSWIDDLRGLSPATRLVAQAVAVGDRALCPAGNPVFRWRPGSEPGMHRRRRR